MPHAVNFIYECKACNKKNVVKIQFDNSYWDKQVRINNMQDIIVRAKSSEEVFEAFILMFGPNNYFVKCD